MDMHLARNLSDHARSVRLMFGVRCADPVLDTKALLAWNGQQAVLSFRGTKSLRNAWSDLQVFMLDHPPARGSWTLGAHRHSDSCHSSCLTVQQACTTTKEAYLLAAAAADRVAQPALGRSMVC